MTTPAGRLDSLATTLKADNRAPEADRLKAALQRINQRDLIVSLSGMATVKPSETRNDDQGTVQACVCAARSKTNPRRRRHDRLHLDDKEPNSQYVVSHAFKWRIRNHVFARLWNAVGGTRPHENHPERRHAATDDPAGNHPPGSAVPIQITVKDGRRTDLATVSPAANQRRENRSRGTEHGTLSRICGHLANPNFYGAAGPRGSAGTPARIFRAVSSLAAKDSKNAPTNDRTERLPSPNGAGVQMTTQVRMSADQRNMDMGIRPFFDVDQRRLAAARPCNLSAIPGGKARLIDNRP
jgi:hypothetical protein